MKRQECKLIIDVYPVMWEQSEPLSFPLTTFSWGPQANGPHAIDSKMPYHKEALRPLVNRQGLGEKEQEMFFLFLSFAVWLKIHLRLNQGVDNYFPVWFEKNSPPIPKIHPLVTCWSVWYTHIKESFLWDKELLMYSILRKYLLRTYVHGACFLPPPKGDEWIKNSLHP